MKAHCNLHRVFFLIVALTSIVACGQVNDDASLVNNTGQHSTGWITLHGADTALSVPSCTQCHGSNLTGGISKVGCFSTAQTSLNGIVCHATSPAVDTGCKSCHWPPPNGTVAPNRAGAHAKHLALAGMTCASCHNDAGYGTVLHANGSGDVSIPDIFKAKAITSTFGYNKTTGECSGIICHGGLTTPKWDTAVTISCQECHTQGIAFQTPQYNSFYSGNTSVSTATFNLHQLHSALFDQTSVPVTKISCTSCHNTNALSLSHFTGITSTAFDGQPAETIGGGTTKISGYDPYTSSVPSGSCTTTCHVTRYWKN